MNTNWILGVSATRRTLARLAALVIAGVMVTACGQKGPLYLPAPDAQPATAAGEPVPDKAETLQDDKEPIKQR